MNDFQRILTALRSADVSFVIVGKDLEAAAELELIQQERAKGKK